MKAAIDHLCERGRRAAAGGRARRHVRARRRRRRLPPRGRRARAAAGRARAGRRRPGARLPRRAPRRGLVSRRSTSASRRCPSAIAARQRRPRQGVAPLRLERVAEAILAEAAPRRVRRPRAAAPRVRPAPVLAAAPAARPRPPTMGALMFTALAAGITSMVVILIVGPAFIDWLRRNEFGQTIREDGPRGPQDQGRHADHGRRAHLARRRSSPSSSSASSRWPRSRCWSSPSATPSSASPTTG